MIMSEIPLFRLDYGKDTFNCEGIRQALPFFHNSATGLILGKVIPSNVNNLKCHPLFIEWVQDEYRYNDINIVGSYSDALSEIGKRSLVWIDLGDIDFHRAKQLLERLRSELQSDKAMKRSDQIKLLVTSTADDIKNAAHEHSSPLINKLNSFQIQALANFFLDSAKGFLLGGIGFTTIAPFEVKFVTLITSMAIAFLCLRFALRLLGEIK
jgi:hypothetical protein